MTDIQLNEFLNSKNYDIRLTHNARWIDQKCTPDVLCIVADCILNYINEVGKDKQFTSKDIWFSEYSIQNIHDIFRKVDVDKASASNEYDKFFGQPLKFFAYAGILEENKIKGTNYYKCINIPILEHVSIRERNALQFLNLYIIKVLKDSKLDNLFDEFFEKQTSIVYDKVKECLRIFNLKYTGIGNKGSDGKLETNRIFTKIINTLAFVKNKKGTEGGRISKHNITYDELMYNRDNFRDIYAEKPKDVSRKDYVSQKHIVINEAYYRYMSAKAKHRLRQYNDKFRGGVSEMQGDLAKATHIHHIFPAGEFPEISHFLENLMALTPNQHLNNAHPNGRTIVIDKDYQHDCLIVKADIIKENLENGIEKIYSFDDFKHVLYVGFSEHSFLDVEADDYDGIKAKIELEYVG